MQSKSGALKAAQTKKKKYGPNYYRELQKKSRLNYNGSGGLRSLSPERRKEISRLGVKKRKQIRHEKALEELSDV